MELVLLLVMALGFSTKGATSWIPLPGGFKLQPSEFAKFATVLALATYSSGLNVSLRNTKDVLISIAIFFIPLVLIVVHGDAGSALVFASMMIALFREGLTSIIYILGILFISLFINSRR